jgi:hypothetical protein
VTEDRKRLIKEIQDIRSSKVICYITGDRDKFPTQIGEDVIPILYRHLKAVGHFAKIDLFLYTRGGDFLSPLRIVKLIRGYCETFGVLVSYRAHSAGTLIALGADEIVMTKLGELTPVDPTATMHHFNPRDPNNPQQMLPVSVEDLRSYFLFAKEELNAQDDQLVDLYANLVKQTYSSNIHLHPLALGNVYRLQRIAKIVTERILTLQNKTFEEQKREKILKEITRDICIHNYPLYKDDVKNLGLNIVEPDMHLEGKLWELYEVYERDMRLREPFIPECLLGQEEEKSVSYEAAYIESEIGQDSFCYDINLKKLPPSSNQPMGRVMVKSKPPSWRRMS